MDRKQHEKIQHGNLATTNKKQTTAMKVDKLSDERVQTQQRVLRDLNTQLSIRAEKMKLLSRAEEGLVQESFNPYSTSTFAVSDGNEITETFLPQPDNMAVDSKIPVSSARERRRNKSSQIEKNKSTVLIKNYRPGYTWNRGGRLKELRIRFLARKHLYKWQRKTFGRVVPSAAKWHYEKRLMRMIFNEWKTMWWEVRKEWRLMIRAECHYRYIMWIKVFHAWKLFVHQQRAKSEKLTIAANHYNSVLLSHVLADWKQFIIEKREINKQKKMADDFHNMNVLRRTWAVWEDRLGLVKHRQQMEVVALQFWAYRIQVQHWLIWCEKMNKRRNAFQKHIFAARHHQFCQKRKCFQALVQYWHHRREKRNQKVYSKLLYERNLKYRMFQTWIGQWHMQLSIHSHEAHIQELSQRFQKRRLLEHWKKFTAIQIEMKEKMNIADLHYIRKLLVLGFSCFKLNTVQHRLKRYRYALATQHYKALLVRRYWGLWLDRCENNEELELIPLTRKALAHYRHKTLCRCWHALQEYVTYRQHRKEQYARADAFFYLHYMPDYLYRMRLFVQIMKEKRENEDKALEFRKENVQARFFYEWYNTTEQSKENRMNERMAILNYEESLKRHYLATWKSKLAISIKDRENEEVALDHFNITLCKKCLQAWIQFVEDRKTSQKYGVIAARHNYIKVISKAMKSWKLYVLNQREKKRKNIIASKFHERKLCTEAFKNWILYTGEKRKFAVLAESRYQIKCAELLRWAFTTWRYNVTVEITDRQSERTAEIYYKRQILHKVLTSWHRYAVIHAYKKSETKQWVESTREVLMKNKLQRCFTAWREMRDEFIVQRLKYEQAAGYHQRKLLTHVLQIWKDYTRVTIKKNLLNKQCTWFNNVRLTSTYFTHWKLQHQLSVEEDRKTDIALWHWSLVLQKKILIAWFSFMEDKKRKKQRIVDALERRRVRLLREGVKQWLCVATDLSGMRAKFAAQQQASDAFEKFQMTQRCALHWKRWAAKRKLDRIDRTSKPRESKLLPLPNHNLAYLPTKEFSRKINTDLPAPVVSTSPVKLKIAWSQQNEVIDIDRLKSRRKPRHPSFLAESLKRAGLFQPDEELSMDTKSREETNGAISDAVQGSHISRFSVESDHKTEQRTVSFDSDKSDNVPSLNNDINELQSRSELQHRITGETKHIYKSDPKMSRAKPKSTRDSSLSPRQGNLAMTKDLSHIAHDLQTKSLVEFNSDEKCQVRLLTPADFMVTSTMKGDEFVIDVTKPEVMSYSPLSTPRMDNVMETLNDRQINSAKSADRNGGSLSHQIITIRNRLKEFDRKKKRLRKLQKQQQQLADWLSQELKGHESEIADVQHELNEIEKEIEDLKKSVEAEKPECAKLVKKVEDLVLELQNQDKG